MVGRGFPNTLKWRNVYSSIYNWDGGVTFFSYNRDGEVENPDYFASVIGERTLLNNIYILKILYIYIYIYIYIYTK